MSLPPPAYLAEVERVFVAQAGRGLLLSPADRELVTRFARAGVPVGVVVEGIERAFAHDPPRRVRSLRYAEPAIEAAVAAWRWRQAGAGPSGPAPDAQVALVAAFAELLDRIAAGRRQGDAPQTAAVDRVWQAVDALRGRFAAGAEADPIAALMRLEDELTSALLNDLDPAARQALEAEINAAPGAGDEDRRQALRWRRLRTRLALPPLELRMGGGSR